MQKNPTTRFTEAEARDILSRALRIEQLRLDGLSLVELRSAATGVGISDTALTAALEQIEAERRARATQRTGLVRLALGYGAAGAALGLAFEGVLGLTIAQSSLEWASVSAMVALMAAGGLAARRSLHGRFRGFVEFQASNFGLWLGFGATTLALASAIGGLEAGTFAHSVFTRITLVLWGVSSVAGGALAAWRARTTAASDATGGVEITRMQAVRRRVAERLKKWIDDVLVRSSAVEPTAQRGDSRTPPVVVAPTA